MMLCRPTHQLIFYMIGLLFSITSWSSHSNEQHSSQQVIRDLFQAFNAHDVTKMVSQLSPDFKWYNVSQSKTNLELSGKENFKKSMLNYFKHLPSARSELKHIHSLGSYVQTIEEALWKSNGVEKSQCSAATYLVENNKVKRVWYFPSFAC